MNKFFDSLTLGGEVFYDGSVEREELEYVPVEVCLLLEGIVVGQRRPAVEGVVPPKKTVFVLRPDAGGSISPEETLTALIGSDGELRLSIREATRLPVNLLEIRRALRRSKP